MFPCEIRLEMQVKCETNKQTLMNRRVSTQKKREAMAKDVFFFLFKEAGCFEIILDL